MYTPTLKPCPFCGHWPPLPVDVGVEGFEIRHMRCEKCGAVGPRATDNDPPGHELELWNRRHGLLV